MGYVIEYNWGRSPKVVDVVIVSISADCTRCLDVLYANTTAQQFPPHFRAFPQLSSRKIPPLALAVARLSSVLCLWFHQDIVIQLYLAQWYSPDNAYIILHRWFPCLFFFFFLTEFLWVTYGSSFAPLKLPDHTFKIHVVGKNAHDELISLFNLYIHSGNKNWTYCCLHKHIFLVKPFCFQGGLEVR